MGSRYIGLTLLVMTIGCGKEKDSRNEGAAEDGKAEEIAEVEIDNSFPKDKATALITGKVIFNGEPPLNKQLENVRDLYCRKHHEDHPILDESLLVGDENAIRNVLIYIKYFPEYWKHAAPTKPVTLSQKKCAYTPHVIGIMKGQPLLLKNEDRIAHNAHFMAMYNRIKRVNFMQAAGQEDEVKLERAELGSAYFKCDIHGWMKAYVCVFNHPFFVVTGEDGTFKLPKLPPGEYEIAAWHETLDTQTQEITLRDGEEKSITFTLKGK